MRRVVGVVTTGLVLLMLLVAAELHKPDEERYCLTEYVTSEARCFTHAEYTERIEGQLVRFGYVELCVRHLVHARGVDLTEPSDTQSGRALALRVQEEVCAEAAATR